MVNSNFNASWQERSTKHLLLVRELQRPRWYSPGDMTTGSIKKRVLRAKPVVSLGAHCCLPSAEGEGAAMTCSLWDRVQPHGTLTTPTASQENTQLLIDCSPGSFLSHALHKGLSLLHSYHYPGITNRVTAMLILAFIRNYVFL